MIDYVDIYAESDGKIAIAIGDMELLLNFEEATALHQDLGYVLQDIAEFAKEYSTVN